jgi:sodium/proton antiporter, NhaD family (TC 2.A.62)
MKDRWIAAALLVPAAALLIAAGLGFPAPFWGRSGAFGLFALTLAGVALLHHYSLETAVAGALALVLFQVLAHPGFAWGHHLSEQAPMLANLLGLLLGFALLARHFEGSGIPDLLPRLLPHDWRGPLALLALVFLLSIFLDNIAAALIGGTVARHVFKGRVHIGYLAAVVAASNAGGAGSVVGDTTTTMMWISGVPAHEVLQAFIASAPAFLIFGPVGAFQQQRLQPVEAHPPAGARLHWSPLLLVILILVGAVVTNVWLEFPAVGVWAVLLLGALFVRTDWPVLRGALRGTFFLLALVFAASLVPVNELPPASPLSTLGLGAISAVFDNIPLTEVALKQGGYDWDFLAYAVGFGGSMIWFGSSAGVALCNLFPEGRSVGRWIRHGWAVPLAYLVGFGALLLAGWHPAPIS